MSAEKLKTHIGILDAEGNGGSIEDHTLESHVISLSSSQKTKSSSSKEKTSSSKRSSGKTTATMSKKETKKKSTTPKSEQKGSNKKDKKNAQFVGENTKTKKKRETSNQKKKTDTSIVFPKTTWGIDSIVSFEATEKLPPPELTSISGGFVFYEEKVILANIPGRGWEIIGGRIDIGESPNETFQREAKNQIGVDLSHVKMIGVMKIEHPGPEPPNCPYPFPIGYGVQYIGIAEELLPFSGSSDSLGRSLVTLEGFCEHYYDWNEYYEAVFQYAYSEYKKLRKKLKI